MCEKKKVVRKSTTHEEEKKVTSSPLAHGHDGKYNGKQRKGKVLK